MKFQWEGSFAKPVVVVSRCFEFEACRYNGLMIPNKMVEALVKHAQLIPVCPEMEIGLGVPRPTLRLVQTKEQVTLRQPDSGADLTQEMNQFSQNFLGNLAEVDGFILKNRSPSCGIRDAKVYGQIEKGAAVGSTSGLFSAQVLERFGHLAVEDEGRLTNLKLRDHFLIKIFMLARYREVCRKGAVKALVQFQTEHKMLMMAYNQTQMRALGKLVGNQQKLPLSELLEEYRQGLLKLLSKPPRVPAMINALMHVFGFFSKRLSQSEKAFFLDCLENYRIARIPLGTVLSLLKGWVIRFEDDYLIKQTLFHPYPEDLIDLANSGKRM